MTTREATIERVLPDIFYEDPEPVEDGMQQELTITLLAFALRWWFSQRPDVFVSAGGFIFWNPANGNERIAPDCYIKLGVAPAFVYQFPNYFVWEVGSPRTLFSRWRLQARRQMISDTSATCMQGWEYLSTGSWTRRGASCTASR